MRMAATLLGAVVFAAPAFAQDDAPVPDHATVAATIAALEAGDAEEAGWLISQVETLAYAEKPYTTPREAIALLSGCKPTETSRRAFHRMAWFSFEWACADETYVGKISPDEMGKSVALVDLMPKARAEEIESRPSVPMTLAPPAPLARRPLTEGERAFAEARRTMMQARQMNRATEFAQAVLSGDVSEFLPRVADKARASFAFHNPFIKQPFYETDGRGPEALEKAVAHGRELLGAPTGKSCSRASYQVICRWSFPDEGKRMFAFVTLGGAEGDDWMISSVMFRYATQEKLQEAQERAGS